ncbi:branched-chain amino acid aminotransferase [Peribacillus sp. SCS-155]|uniref:branched-chain amino acid aminotransferase n=1 Tax=Peribacillus sedimenti TaxID=3115297 RepID=UPI00390663A4
MLKDTFRQLLQSKVTNDNNTPLPLYKEESEFAEKHGLITDLKVNIIETTSNDRFENAYIERSDKESENTISTEEYLFLNQPVSHFKKNMNEFIYVESDWFEMLGVDAVSLEIDDIFGTYDVLLGLRLQKKLESEIRAYIQKNMPEEARYSLMFNNDEGLWELNFSLNFVAGFNEDMSIGDAYKMIYLFLFKLVEAAEQGR